ncbi:glyoxalase [Bradyrhizobium sacchari]|uniref:Glyoxalase/bleomycin resistance protein/dioxygenase superfamily protein n=1 Tax=Bradyrhizobium sacchari TaxID=1399419 RepID=A0A560JWU4_9BRAD|nr:VOC family protein [Bradyrhizobium sacchari]OPY98187.1 glyoxalase [Bradyrhizobium sacchari]TWB58820.1 glyoxalase/bleomycin resistance protein/dioxygenase superfamily protein [Bradyrhizobium sacchari]TWB72820.1 glyoxalase/bleomycin resistance protein/dioxygenase superfamily protein [Bradyrhizobium sacchari]
MTLPRAYIEHVAIRVPDIDRHVDFFRQVLGLGIRDEQAAEGARPRQVWVLGSVQLIEDPSFVGPEGRLAHLGIMVDDYDGVLARAAAWGATALPAGPNWLELPGGLNVEILQASAGAVEVALAINPRA